VKVITLRKEERFTHYDDDEIELNLSTKRLLHNEVNYSFLQRPNDLIKINYDIQTETKLYLFFLFSSFLSQQNEMISRTHKILTFLSL
jgi:hypothetical protein